MGDGAGGRGRAFRPPARRVARSLGGGAVTLGIVLLVVTSGAAARAPITFAAPYSHVAQSDPYYLTSAGCAYVAGHRPHWLASTGVGHLSAHALAKKCALVGLGVGAGSYAYAAGEVVLVVPIRTFQGGATPTSVEVDWNLSVNSTSFAKVPGRCPAVAIAPTTGNGTQYCDFGTEEVLGAGAVLVDRTNGSVFYDVNPWAGLVSWRYNYSDTFCVTFSCSTYSGAANSSLGNVSGSFLVRSWINASLNHFDQYDVETWVSASAYSYLDGYGKGSAVSTVDLATPGHDLDLTGITVR